MRSWKSGLSYALDRFAGLDDDVARAVDLAEAHDRARRSRASSRPARFRAELLLAVLGLLGPLARAVLADVGFEVGDLLLLPLGLPLEHLGLLGAEPPVLRVVAGVGLDLSLVQLPDLGDDLVEEVAVVADDDHRHRLPRQVVLEPGGRLDVEVVRGLVQEHQVGALEQQLGEHQPRLLAARERPGRTVEVGRREPQAAEDLLDAVVDRVGVLVLEPVVQLVVAAAGPVAVVLVLGLGHLLGRLLELALQVEERGQARPGHVHQRLVGPELGLLAQQADPDAGPDVEMRRNPASRSRPSSFISVVLPAPLGPTRPIRSPARTSNARSWKIGSPAYCRPRPLAEMRIMGLVQG